MGFQPVKTDFFQRERPPWHKYARCASQAFCRSRWPGQPNVTKRGWSNFLQVPGTIISMLFASYQS